MNAAELYDEEEAIFSQYEAFYFRHRIIRDGALGGPESDYQRQNFRVLFVLKEGNDPREEWAKSDIRWQGEDSCHDSRYTWPSITRWAALATSPGFSESFAAATATWKCPASRAKMLRRVAVVNLKKFGGASTAIHRSIANEVRDTSELLLRQLALYKPHLTIAGGDFALEQLALLYGKPIKRLSSKAPGNLQQFHCTHLKNVVGCWHPAARDNRETIFLALQAALKLL